MITRAAATVRQPILVCRKSINLTDFTNNKMTFYIVLIGLFELLNIILYKVVKEHAKETPKERICVVPTRRKPKSNKSGHSPMPLVGTYCRLSAHIAACRHIFSPTVSPCLCKKASTHLFPTLSPPPSPLLLFDFNLRFDFYSRFCSTSFTAVHFICGLALK